MITICFHYFQLGVYNSLVWSLLMYGIRYVGYSHTNCAWYAFPFEALEVFTFAHLQVASAKFIRDIAPPGALATLTGITGGAHNGLGKGMGGLLGGVLIEVTKNTKMAFYYFGLFAFGCGGLYGLFVNVLMRLMKKSGWISEHQTAPNSDLGSEPELEGEAEPDKVEPLLQERLEGDGYGFEEEKAPE